MTRAVSVGRSFNGLWPARALGLALLTISWAGCAGSLDPAFSGGAGSSGTAGMGTAGTTGMAGTTGTAGGGMGCDITPLFIGPASKYKCSETGACHDATGGGGNFIMATADWQTHLVGVVPKGGGAVASMCATNATFKTMPYIISRSQTGDGLLMQKIKGAPCGLQMPFGGAPMTAADITCAQQWATALANQ